MMGVDLVVLDMTADEARAAVDAIRQDIDTMIVRLNELWSRRAWLALGYESWGDLCAIEFPNRQLPRDRRGEAIGELRAEGMSTRAIGDALGVSHPTVLNDLAGGQHLPPAVIVGTDGKRYSSVRDSDAAFMDRVRNLDPDRVRELLANDDEELPRWEPSGAPITLDTMVIVVVAEVIYDGSADANAYGPFASKEEADAFADTIPAFPIDGGYPPQIRILTVATLANPADADWLENN